MFNNNSGANSAAAFLADPFFLSLFGESTNENPPPLLLDDQLIPWSDEAFTKNHGRLYTRAIDERGVHYLIHVFMDVDSDHKLKCPASLRLYKAASRIMIAAYRLKTIKQPGDVLDVQRGFGDWGHEEPLPLGGTNGWAADPNPNASYSVEELSETFAEEIAAEQKVDADAEAAPSPKTTWQEGDSHFQARVMRGQYVPGEFNKTIRITRVDEKKRNKRQAYKEATVWETVGEQMALNVARLCQHKESESKDGPVIVYADIEGTGRNKNSVKSIGAVVLDDDSGTPNYQHDKFKYFHVTGTTHSNGKDETEIPISKLEAFGLNLKGDAEKNMEAVKRYFRAEKKRPHESIIDSMKYVGDGISAKNLGHVATISHIPWPKRRTIILLDKPYDMLAEARNGGLKAAQERYISKCAIVAKTFGIEQVDKTRFQPNQMAYLFSHPKGNEFSIEIWPGDLMNLDDVAEEGASVEDQIAAQTGESGGGRKSKTEEARKVTPWWNEHARSWAPVGWMEQYAPGLVKGAGGVEGSAEIICPWHESHTNGEETGCIVINAKDSRHGLPVVSCRGGGCAEKTALDLIGGVLAHEQIDEVCLYDPNFIEVEKDGEYLPLAMVDPDSVKRFEERKARWIAEKAKRENGAESQHSNPEGEEECEPEQPQEEHVDDVEARIRAIKAKIAALTAASSGSEVSAVLGQIGDCPPPVVGDLLKLLQAATGRTKKELEEGLRYEQQKSKATEDGPAAFPGDKVNKKTAKYLKEVELKYPLPYVGHGYFRYGMFENRAWLYMLKDQAEDGTGGHWVRLHTPLTIKSGVLYKNRDDMRGLRLQIQNVNGKDVLKEYEAGLAFHSRGNDLLKNLSGADVGMTSQGEWFIIAQFKQVTPRDPVVIYDQAGWHGNAFLTAFGVAINTNEPIELAGDNMPEGVKESGTAAGWTAAANAALSSGVLPLQIGILAGLASPIVQLAGYSTLMLYLMGQSTQGKTTCLNLGGSAWGDVTPKKGLVGNFNGTVRSSEALLQRGSGNFWGYDEAHLIAGDDFQDLVYKASGNSGADRLKRNADLRRARSWALFMLFSGEHSVAEKLRQVNKGHATGLGTRMLEIGVDGVEELTPEKMQEIEAAYQNVGHAGPAFVRQMISMSYDAAKLDTEIAALVTKLAGVDATPAMRRAAKIAAVLWKTGLIARAAGLIDASEKAIEGVARAIWQKACEAEIAATDPVGNAIKILFENLISRRGGDVGEGFEVDEKAKRNHLAWRDDVLGAYVIPVVNLSKLAGGQIGDKALTAAMKKRGLLTPRNDGNGNAWDYVKELGKIRSVVVPISCVEDEPVKAAEPAEEADNPEEE